MELNAPSTPGMALRSCRRVLFVFIGVCQFLGGVGFTLPAMTGVKRKLTPFAAFDLPWS